MKIDTDKLTERLKKTREKRASAGEGAAARKAGKLHRRAARRLAKAKRTLELFAKRGAKKGE